MESCKGYYMDQEGQLLLVVCYLGNIDRKAEITHNGKLIQIIDKNCVNEVLKCMQCCVEIGRAHD